MIYAVTKVVLAVLFKIFYRFSVKGRENLGRGPTILVANHTSYLDPIAAGLAVPWPIFFIAKEELFSIPILGWYIRKLHAFPIKRGAVDRQVMRTSLDHLKKSRTVLIFPEGMRHRDDGLAEGQPGAAFIAYKGGATIVPTAISGTDRVYPKGAKVPRFPKISVSFGAPIAPYDAEDKKEYMGRATETMMREIETMLAGRTS